MGNLHMMRVLSGYYDDMHSTEKYKLQLKIWVLGLNKLEQLL